MRVTINSLVFGAGTRRQITPTLAGLGRPKIRTSGDDFSGTDGGYVSAQRYSRRMIVLAGYIEGSTEQVESEMSLITNTLPIRQLLPIFIETFTGKQFYTEGYITDIQDDITADNLRIFQIMLIAPDPYLYDAGDGIDPDSGWLQQTFGKVIGGGFILPVEVPIVSEPSSHPTAVNNSGDIIIYPQIVLNGIFTNPRIINLTTGKFVALTITTTARDRIVIDMRARTITLNGGTISTYRIPGSSWWELLTGDNIVVLETDSGDDTETALIRWRAAYEGV